MSNDLVQFLRDRLDEDERQANAAMTYAAASWFIETSGIVTTGPDDDVYTNDREVAEHIARHDPARVLREVDAKRRILRAHAKWCEGRCEATYPEGGFDAAHYWSIKALATVYVDHPAYLPEWRP